MGYLDNLVNYDYEPLDCFRAVLVNIRQMIFTPLFVTLLLEKLARKSTIKNIAAQFEVPPCLRACIRTNTPLSSISAEQRLIASLHSHYSVFCASASTQNSIKNRRTWWECTTAKRAANYTLLTQP